MDSLSPDLRDALDEALARRAAAGGGGSTNAPSSSSSASLCCAKCEKLAAAVDSLRWCGGCRAVKYCSDTCARADWPVHKLMCKKLREVRDKSVADWEASGGGNKKTYKQASRDMMNWYRGVPGLGNEVCLLAWKHRSESPVIRVTAIMIEEGAAHVSVMPRSFWDEDPRFIETFDEDMRERICMDIDGADFSPDAHYVVLLDMKDSVPHVVSNATLFFQLEPQGILRAVEIVDALTSAATTREDLAAAIAWCKGRILTTSRFIPDYFERQAAAHGPSRANGVFNVPRIYSDDRDELVKQCDSDSSEGSTGDRDYKCFGYVECAGCRRGFECQHF
jgi:hypothetical protein